MVDFIADYQQRVDQLPVRSAVSPGYLRLQLPDAAPERPQGLQDILADVESHIMPGMTHWQSPYFYGWFRCGCRCQPGGGRSQEWHGLVAASWRNSSSSSTGWWLPNLIRHPHSLPPS